MSKLVINSDVKSDTIIVTFTGYATQKFDFKTILSNNFKNIDKHFYIDKFQNSYHNGIDGISVNINETINYLRNEIEGYKKVIFMGVSSGGYAAILFGSLLNITIIIGFIPQTKLFKTEPNLYNESYRDLTNIINKTSKYYIYGDLSIGNKTNCHHISHCHRIKMHDNVKIIEHNNLNLRLLSANGELLNILIKHILTE